ncbi:Tar ligand binding domain-containing protein [Pseudomonas fluorescens]|jgi:methyl-accepting chemotaxis protein|uniref:Tar ligand binding domain-containing protein n=1 Tax=Pseudomonas fluorescens TaxID=294 RepID=UPI00277F7395|nr:hypothetical protein [Pseudomonas fluorescens]
MFAHLKVRTGMAGVLLLFVVALLYSTLNNWSAAEHSFDQLDELSRTSDQIDGINKALLLAIRTSANVSSAFIETVGGRFDDAEERLVRSERIWTDAMATVTSATADLRDPKLKALSEDLKGAFDEYGAAIVGQRAATRARSADQYFQVNIAAGNGMTKLQEIRTRLVGALDARAQEITQDAASRLATSQILAVVLGLVTLAWRYCAGCSSPGGCCVRCATPASISNASPTAT